MHPVLERHLLHPPVLSAAVVGHDVHDDLDSVLMRDIHHLLIEGVVAETGVDIIVVRACITVI